MSRIGLKPINIPAKVDVKIENGVLTAKGPLGEMKANIPTEIKYSFENGVLSFTRESELKKIRALHGLTRALCFNAIHGVSEGFSKTMIIEGVGFKTEMKENNLQLSLGFSHLVLVIPPKDVKFEIPAINTLKVSGINKQVVGQVCAKIRDLRPPEPYKGKGIRYQGEYIRRKAGKTAGK